MRISLKHWLRRKRSPWLKIFYDSFKRYKRDKREAIRQDFIGLDAKATVLDFGGFEGDWAYDIHQRYNCAVHVFEPHPHFATELRKRFEGNAKIFIHEYALGKEDGVLNLSDEGNASSALRVDENAVEGKVVAVSTFFDAHADTDFGLVKINIEGGEYDLLPALIDAGFMPRIGILQVQFHLYSENLIDVRQNIVNKIEQTHSSDWSYPFVWEQWTQK